MAYKFDIAIGNNGAGNTMEAYSLSEKQNSNMVSINGLLAGNKVGLFRESV